MLEKILIYGSTLLTQEACILLQAQGYNLVGYVPSRAPTVMGKIPLEKITKTIPEHDIKLSLGYDMRIRDYENAFNVHPGLLPEFGGCDILYHTIRTNSFNQGLTFHKMVHSFDAGPIIAKTSYPVFPDDKIIDLYYRVMSIYPSFVLYALRLLEQIGLDRINLCKSYTPTLYRRGDILEEDRLLYEETFRMLKELEKAND